MIKIAIIAEYNPFHNGHKYQIECVRREFPQACIIALMSGNFVQRGEGAILPKYLRAEIAVKCGVNAVLELPYPYSSGNAEYFARGAIEILNSLGVDYLCFGSECGDVDTLMNAVRRLLSDDFQAALYKEQAEKLSSPLSYIKLYRDVYYTMYGEELPDGANNTLALEYLKAMVRTNSKITPLTVRRFGIASATKSREVYHKGDYTSLSEMVPDEAIDYYKNHKPVSNLAYESTILSFFRICEPGTLKQYADVNDGLEQRLFNAAQRAKTLDEFFRLCATKKYTNAKIRRIVFYCLLKVREKTLKEKPRFTSLLAADKTGTTALREFKKTSKIVILTKPAAYVKENEKVKKQFELNLKADRLYALSCGENGEEQIKKTPFIALC